MAFTLESGTAGTEQKQQQQLPLLDGRYYQGAHEKIGEEQEFQRRTVIGFIPLLGSDGKPLLFKKGQVDIEIVLETGAIFRTGIEGGTKMSVNLYDHLVGKVEWIAVPGNPQLKMLAAVVNGAPAPVFNRWGDNSSMAWLGVVKPEYSGKYEPICSKLRAPGAATETRSSVATNEPTI